MSEVAQLNPDAEDMTFPERVWYVLSRIDVKQRTEKKGRFDYLPWADAWQLLMENFPESSYHFEEPKFWPNGTGEQWVTVTVKDGENQFSRSWWLPYLDHGNKPLENPTSLQINNTRMRVLVKCIAMMGLGIEVFSGEDVPDKELDEKPVAGAKMRAIDAALEGISFTPKQLEMIQDYRSSFMRATSSEDVMGILELVDELRDDQELKMGIWAELDSKTRTYIRKVEKERG